MGHRRLIAALVLAATLAAGVVALGTRTYYDVHPKNVATYHDMGPVTR